MRIIGGIYGGRVLRIPKGLPARPTTDRAKEALFNMLTHRIDWEVTDVLDLFTGTGNIAIECASRGAKSVVAVDQDSKSVAHLQSLSDEWGISRLLVRKVDVFTFLKQAPAPYGLIFLDPPYDWARLDELLTQLLSPTWLADDGLLVAEHRSNKDLSQLPGWIDSRAYGDSRFTFFELPPPS